MEIKAKPTSKPAEMTDAELLSAVRTEGQSKAALNELLSRQYHWLSRMCFVEFRETNAALDCLQDIMIEIAKSISRFDGRSELKTWIYVIAKRTIYRHRRKASKLRERFPLGKEDDISSSDSSALMRSTSDSEKLILTSESNQQLLSRISELPEQQRHAVLFHYFEDLSVEDTAARMGCAAGTVKVHLFRARNNLRNLLER